MPSLLLETPRTADEAYQRDHALYSGRIRQLQFLVSVRADDPLKRLLRSTQVRILNRGRAEAFSRENVVYFDMAILDLLDRFSDELSVAEVKSDAVHQMEFNLSYAVALNGNKALAFLDVDNTAAYTEEQKNYLWREKLRVEEVIFDHLLGFILAHEISHIALEHEQAVRAEFPDERTRTKDNPRWNKRRREMELEADELAARICLNALIQPAQLLTWLDLTEIRRRFYGTSAEYPTTAQRISVIQRAYDDTFGKDHLQIDLRTISPLPPDREVAQVDAALFLDEFRKVRAYLRQFLVIVDQQMIALFKEKRTLEEIASSFLFLVEQQRDFFRGAARKEVLDELIRVVSGAGDYAPDLPAVKGLLDRAGIGKYACEVLTDLLDQKPVDWVRIAGHLSILKRNPEQFSLGLTYDYLLANTVLRWHPAAFAVLQSVLPETEVKAKKLKPYQLDKPTRSPLPGFEERVALLKMWDGRYA